jgi:hypothetical protein
MPMRAKSKWPDLISVVSAKAAHRPGATFLRGGICLGPTGQRSPNHYCPVAFILLLICRFSLRSATQMAFAAISRSNCKKRLFPRSGPIRTKINWPNSTSFVFAKTARMLIAAFLRDKMCTGKTNRGAARFGERGDCDCQPSGGKL